MNNKLDNYNKLVDLIGNIIKATNNPNDQKDIDNALDIAHTVGNTLKVIADKMIIKFHNMKMTTNNIPQGKVTPLGIIPNEWEILQLKNSGKYIQAELQIQMSPIIGMAIFCGVHLLILPNLKHDLLVIQIKE